MIQKSLSVKDGGLCFAGVSARELAEKFSTPLYVMDENRLRENMRVYTDAAKNVFPAGSLIAYASKALCFKGLYPILAEEGMGADLVSGGEIYTALKAGFPMEKTCFHGNCKTDSEIALALESGVGFIMADGFSELERVGALAAERGMTANVILRLTPGIDPHTFEAVNTGSLDCQFGIAIETGDALEFTKAALATKNIAVKGFHCHIGSQIFTTEPFLLALEVMTGFMKQAKDECGFDAEYLALGGGIGVPYVESEPAPDTADILSRVGKALYAACETKGLSVPKLMLEPGRSIVADAGITIYTAGQVKEIKGGSSFVITDGGMSDNPRYALYRSPYTVYNADRMDEPFDRTYTVTGRCCESGDVLQKDVKMPETKAGDLIAVCCTGAYNYAMAGNYNRLGKPPIILIKDGVTRVAVRRQSYDDMMADEL